MSLAALAYARRSWRVFGSGAAPDAYAIGGASPELVAAFTLASDGTTAGEYFRKASSETTFSGLFTFSRSGTATYFDSNGTLQTAADGVARRQAYRYNSGWELAGMQLEGAAATNLIEDSSDFTAASWNAASGSVTADQTTSPDGTENADLFDADSATNARLSNINAFTVSTTYTASVYVKANGASTVAVGAWSNSTSKRCVAEFNLSTVSVNSNSENSDLTFVDARIESVGGGWYRCEITFTTSPTSSSGSMVIGFLDGGSGNLASVGTETIYLYGAQLEASSVATSYIPTNGSTVTRAAETLSIAGADTPANTTAMSISMKGLMTYADNGAAAQETFLRWYADANNYISLDLDTDSTATGEVNANQSTAGALDTVVAGAEYSPGVNVAFNIASRHTSGAVNVAKDGTAATADTTPTALADLSSTTLELGYDFNGFISELRVWGADIGDSGIAEVTS